MNNSKKSFEQLKKELIEALQNKPVVLEIDFQKMKERLTKDCENYERGNRARSFTFTSWHKQFNM